MPTPTIPAGNLFMNATLYTGNGTTNVITNGNAGQSFQPDLVWCKSRSTALFHGLYNVVSGAGSTKGLYSNDTAAEGAYSAYQNLVSFNSNGFTLGATSSQNNINENGTTFVAWQWKAGGTAVTNTAGTISSQVSANTTSGFSVVTYTGNGTSGATFGHGLGVTPSMIIIKNRGTSAAWAVNHASIGATQYLNLNTTGAVATDTTVFQNRSSTTVTLGTDGWVNGNTMTYVAYCWSEIAGFSKFGSYTANNSADGPFVYTGFRPRFILFKCTTVGADWEIYDSARDTYNVETQELKPNTSGAESTNSNAVDFLSNGFKLRKAAGDPNYSTNTYIYMAFAENPFKYANAR